MGCDGGTIPRRDELVRVKKKPEAKDKDSELSFQWRCCAITQQVLREPVVVCGLGRLYNKVALIEALLNRELLPESAKHIKSLKDVKNLNLAPNPVHKDAENKSGTSSVSSTQSAPYICPVIGLEMSGKFRFIALWGCGCVFSERALKEVQTTTCHKCQQSFNPEDVVVINGNEEDLLLMRSRMELRQAMKKKNKKKIKVEKEETAVTESAASGSADKPDEKSIKAVKNEVCDLDPSKLMGMKRTGDEMSRLGSDKEAKKAKADYSVAKDPNASDVYKSLFTTHKSEQEQGRAHWITYNPFYN